MKRSEAQRIDADADDAQRARDRRSARAFAGWLAGHMRMQAQARRRQAGEGPARH